MQERESIREPIERVPEELKAYHHWVNWKREDDKKVPVNPYTLGHAGVHWHNTWASFDNAQAAARRSGLGLGFVLTEDDPYTVVDLDDCVGEKGRLSAQTRDILDLLSGWVELSPSETGLHIWVRNEAPVNRRGQGIEIYSAARWITVTGRSNLNAPLVIPERTSEVAELARRYFREEQREFAPPAQLPAEDDDEIWQRLFHSKNGDFFRALYAGDASVCYNDRSRAVIMLANQLALMTDLDANRVKRLLYQTGLVNEKWEEKRGTVTWIEYQIQDAIRYVAGKKR